MISVGHGNRALGFWENYWRGSQQVWRDWWWPDHWIWSWPCQSVHIICPMFCHSSCNSSQSLFLDWRENLSRILSKDLEGGNPSFSDLQIPSLPGPFEPVGRIFVLAANKNKGNLLNIPPSWFHPPLCMCTFSKKRLTLLLSPAVLFLLGNWNLAGLNLILLKLTATGKLLGLERQASHVTFVVDPWCCAAPQVSTPQR